MNVLLDCAGCGDQVLFEVDEAAEQLSCPTCHITVDFAPDPVATFALLYPQAA